VANRKLRYFRNEVCMIDALRRLPPPQGDGHYAFWKAV